MRLFLFLILLVLLSGCGAIPGNSQVDAGMTRALIEWKTDKDGISRISRAEIINGKEMQDVRLRAKLADGTSIDYSATAVKAFQAHAVRSAVEKQISSDVREMVPGIVDNIVTAITGLP